MRSIFVNYDGAPLLVQTPWLHSWDGVALPPEEFRAGASTAKYSVNCTLQGAQENEAVASFQQFLQQFDSKIIADVAANSAEWLKQKSMDPVVCEALYTRQLKLAKDKDTGEATNKYPPTFKVKMPFYDGVWKCDAYTKDDHAAHVNGELSELIKGKCRIRFIMQCNGVWSAANKFGVSWTAKQIEYELAPVPAQQKGYGFRGE